MASALAGSSVLDVEPGHLEHDVGPAVLRALASKGFALISADNSRNFGSEALDDIKAIDAAHQLERPPQLVAEGILGERGAVRICELSSPQATPEDWEGEAIRYCDDMIAQLGETLEPLVSELGISLVGRTPGLVIESGDVPSDDPPELTNEVATKWLGILTRAKLLVLHFLGPGWGNLELRVSGDEDDTEPFNVHTHPGMTVILLTDTIIYEHTSAQTSYAVASYACGERTSWYKRPTAELLNPAVAAIDRWVVDSMTQVKKAFNNEDETALDPSAIPRSMQRMMNRMFVKGERAAVRGTSAKLGNTTNMDMFHNATTPAVDFAQEVPYTRWNHQEVYHPDLESYNYGKVYSMHGSFTPGLDMFDNKFFLISPAEASKMDVCERQILEVGYEAFARAGVKKKELMGSDCGIYVAWISEVSTCEDRGMGANRASFCLGCKGPSLSCDVDHASALLAVKVATNELGRACNQGIAIGCSVMCDPNKWIVHCAAHLLSPAGRTCSFDANASGFIRGDLVGSVYVKRLAEKVDGEEVYDEKVHFEGVITSAVCKNQGRTATLRSVNGPCLQEVFGEGLFQTKISPLDMDIVECDSKGDVMQDGIEVTSIMRAFRPSQESISINEPVTIGCGKTNMGNAWYASGMLSMLKTLAVGMYGTISPVVHINQINPLIHTEAFDKPLNVPAECLQTAAENCYAAVNACGWGGTNAQIVIWNRVDQSRMFLGRPEVAEKPVFWPGGGGMLGFDQKPVRSYSIVGSWSSWTNPEPMELEDEGVYGYTITLGENCWEMFQIWLDGDDDRVLHPGRSKSGKSTPARGPDQVGVHMSWLIDGRAMLVPEGEDLDAPLAIGDYGPASAVMQPYAGSGGADGLVEMPHGDRGWPGAQYRVRLRIAGKWRSVDWELTSMQPTGPPAISNKPEVKGSYFVTGSFNSWGFEELTASYSAQGTYSTEVTLFRDVETFQLARNQDWQQAIYPSQRNATGTHADVLGPDDMGAGQFWQIRGKVGDIYSIDFQRTMDESGFQTMVVTWRFVRNQRLDQSRLESAQSLKYFLVGTWDSFRTKSQLEWDGTQYKAEMTVKGIESFQILLGGSWSAVLFPSVPDATPKKPHGVAGPSEQSPELMWLIGQETTDDEVASATYMIRLLVSNTGRPLTVQWERR